MNRFSELAFMFVLGLMLTAPIVLTVAMLFVLSRISIWVPVGFVGLALWCTGLGYVTSRHIK